MFRVGGPEQDARREETSKWYWRNWLLVDATCWLQREMEVKVSRPLKRRCVERLLDVFLKLSDGFILYGWNDMESGISLTAPPKQSHTSNSHT